MRTFLRYTGYVLLGLLVLLVVLGSALYFRGRAVAHQTHEIKPVVTSVKLDSALLARGEHLSTAIGCRHCHGEKLGGRVFVDEPPFRLTAPNLTRGEGGIGASYRPIDWARAIRHGVDPAGEALVAMPSASYHALSDEDLNALIAYLQQLPPVDHSPPPTRFKTFGYLLIGAGQIDPSAGVVPSTSHPSAVPVGATVEYGRYLYHATCEHCHGTQLRGGPHPDPAGLPVPSLRRPGVWSYPAFRRAVTEGDSPTGRKLNDKWMPWSAFAHLQEDELLALHRFVQTELSDDTTASPTPMAPDTSDEP